MATCPMTDTHNETNPPFPNTMACVLSAVPSSTPVMSTEMMGVGAGVGAGAGAGADPVAIYVPQPDHALDMHLVGPVRAAWYAEHPPATPVPAGFQWMDVVVDGQRSTWAVKSGAFLAQTFVARVLGLEWESVKVALGRLDDVRSDRPDLLAAARTAAFERTLVVVDHPADKCLMTHEVCGVLFTEEVASGVLMTSEVNGKPEAFTGPLRWRAGDVYGMPTLYVWTK